MGQNSRRVTVQTLLPGAKPSPTSSAQPGTRAAGEVGITPPPRGGGDRWTRVPSGHPGPPPRHKLCRCRVQEERRLPPSPDTDNMPLRRLPTLGGAIPGHIAWRTTTLPSATSPLNLTALLRRRRNGVIHSDDRTGDIHQVAVCPRRDIHKLEGLAHVTRHPL